MPGVPEAGWSLENELEFADRARDDELEDEWRRADFITCASSFTRRSLVESGCPAEKVTVIPYGFDAGRVTFEAAAKAGPLRVLFVGQGVQRKGLHHLLRTWRDARLGGATLTCVCYRADPGLVRGAPQGVRFLPKLSREALDAEFARAQVFVLPSLIEGFGLVIPEALARGCHVIAITQHRASGPRAPARSGERGRCRRPTALAAALDNVARRHERGELDHEGARRLAVARPWAAFRAEIAAHAEGPSPCLRS
jgi:glycosyltransferase involved in cell wall biosynthesis